MILSPILDGKWKLQEALKPNKMDHGIFVAIIRTSSLPSETARAPQNQTMSSKFLPHQMAQKINQKVLKPEM